jgi:hypothetical protein
MRSEALTAGVMKGSVSDIALYSPCNSAGIRQEHMFSPFSRPNNEPSKNLA